MNVVRAGAGHPGSAPAVATITDRPIVPLRKIGLGDITTVPRLAGDTEDVMPGPKLIARYVGLFSGTFLAIGFGATLLWWIRGGSDSSSWACTLG
jgi:hypothetical protein